jgi:hypothetical protein
MSLEKILCFGSLNPDLIYFVDEVPKKVMISEVQIHLSERVVQQLIVLKKLFFGTNLFM